ncbi:DUF6457 domain-containing protein [Nocardioides massiliensis]|uniref:DUF6457 domain-containing protein n=1 Tax=Nocardioides massiliensis TaxID=1325935 RepID=A0ABT9NLC0_9ACTN|nr:DUF6457 domain-containing protein [Nocardioides massiliensis]MDP9821209.1 hypothetical protein [Nocardioides massiliensis]
MNLHDWIDEVCDVLDLDHEIDEGLVLDLARVCAHGVERPAAPVTSYLLGYAAGARGLSSRQIEELAERVTALAERWDRPAADDADDPADLGPDDPPDADLATALGEDPEPP